MFYTCRESVLGLSSSFWGSEPRGVRAHGEGEELEHKGRVAAEEGVVYERGELEVVAGRRVLRGQPAQHPDVPVYAHLEFGRIVVSGIEARNMLVDPV